MEGINDRNDLTTGVVWKKLLGFFFPILFGLLFQQLYNTVDAIIVGRFIDSSALAAVGGGASSITNLIIGFFTGLNSGATVIIAQCYGAHDHEGLSKVLHSFMVFSILIGLAITVMGYFLAPWALRLINNPEDIMEDSVLYLRIYMTGSVPLLLYNLFQGTLQGVGDSRRPLIYLITSCVLNIILDLLFVAVFHWGVAGVGWASVISMAVCMMVALIHLKNTDGPHRVRFKKLRVDFTVLRQAMRIGLPAGLQSTMYSIANMIILSSVNSFGTTVVAGWTATGKVDGFYWVTSNAFGVALCAFVGQCYGAKKIDRMKEAVRVCMKIALTVTVVLSAVLLAIARPAYSLFLKEPEVIDAAVEIMRYFVPFYFLWTFIEVLTASFRGVGDAFWPMIIVMLTTCVFRIIWMFTVVPHWHTIFSVSIVFAISWVLSAASFIVYYFKSDWMNHGIKRK